MEPSIYLHIGMPKTATTSSQEFFTAHRQTLLEEKVLYPQACLQHTAHHPVGGAFSRFGIDWIVQHDPAEMRDALRREIAETTPRAVLLSTETLYYEGIDVKGVRDWLDFAEVKVIVSLRMQDDWMESALRDNYKTGHFRGNVDQYVQRVEKRLDYAKVLEEWAQIFGKENINVMAFEPGPGLEAPERTLLRILGVSNLDGLGKASRANDRLNRDTLAWLMASPDRHRTSAFYFRLFSLLADWSAVNPDKAEHLSILPPGLRRDLRERFAASNAWVASTFLDRADGTLFSNPSTISEVWEEYTGLTVGRSVEIGQWLAQRLIRR